MKVIAGIDPGLNGGICIIKPAEQIDFNDFRSLYQKSLVSAIPHRKVRIWSGLKTLKLRLQTRVSPELVSKYLSAHKVTHCYLEQQQARPNQNSVSTATTFLNYGILWAILTLLNIKVQEVSPQQWQQLYKLEPFSSLIKDNNCIGKERSITIARHYGVNLKPNKYTKLDSDGLADAFCIAFYGLLEELNYSK